MNKQVCEKFENLWDKFPDKLDSSNNYQFKTENFLDSYCVSDSCDTAFEKINGGCLYLFNKIFGSSELFKSVANSNINIVDYILIWLSYMLNLKEQQGNDSNLPFFYNTTINNDRYQKIITDVTEYSNYKDLIDQKKYFLDMDKKIISNFYEAFKLLCEMYAEFDDKTQYCAKCSKNAIQFVSKYKEMNQNSDITSNGSYNELLSTLSNDYNNFKEYCNSKGNKCKDYPDLLTIEKNQNFAQKIAQSSEDTPSSSSITTRLFTVLSIFGAIGFLLGISYKYSLFGFRKRFQKQKLREKIKNIKKKMNQ
ncbi:YIR protein [Plasmodium yoelii]|uniref:YIR protein n=1 Tax=Plasmodium yoelii TaxID=5861 RepID=A0A077X8A9_PLAYE|nr:YIR protein [Plasmodium yoelii]